MYNLSLLETLCILSRNYCLICEGMMKADAILSSIRWMDVEGKTQVPIEAKKMIKISIQPDLPKLAKERFLVVESSRCL